MDCCPPDAKRAVGKTRLVALIIAIVLVAAGIVAQVATGSTEAGVPAAASGP